MTHKVKKFLILVCALYISGCAASGPRFYQINEPPTELSQIYIYRPWALSSGGVGLPIVHNGEQLSHPLSNQGYLNYLAQAGHHKMYVNAEGLIDRVLEFDTLPGETYFIKLTIQNYLAVMGTRLSLVDKEIALKEIKNCKLSTTGFSLKSVIQEDVPTMGAIAKAEPSPPGQKKLIADELRKLSELKNEGIITEEEFEKIKAQLLSE